MYDDADDYEPWDGWRGAMMGNAGRDPVYRAALAIAEADHPDAADFCVRCHSMSTWLSGRSSLPEWSEAEGPRLAPDEPAFVSDDQNGVACQVCHRAIDDVPSDPEAPHLQNAQIYFADGASGGVRNGPYDYVAGGGPMHETAVSTFLPEARFCGQCHDILNPILEGHRADGTPTGRPFVIERTFSEWQSSAFAGRNETCQDCHMPRMETPVRASNDETMPLRDYFRRHELLGGMSWVQRALATTVPDRSGDWIAALRRSADKAEAFLQTAAELEIVSSAMMDGNVSATVRVTNLTGHKLPTGYPEGRRMWLSVEIVDETGAVTGGSGLYDEETGTLAMDAQIRTYEIKLGQGTTPSFHFVLNDTLLEDTRIPPEGFAPAPDLDIAPVGRDYSDGAGGYRNYDETSYAIRACGEGALTLRVRLRYQSTIREYIEFLRDNAPDSLDPDITNWGEIAYQLWEANGGKIPTDMAEVTMPLGDSPGECATPMDGGTSDAGVPADGGPRPPGDSGCACRVAAASPPARPPVITLAATAALLFARRRRPR
jgi:MYXO-CTERM domain-containing protein